MLILLLTAVLEINKKMRGLYLFAFIFLAIGLFHFPSIAKGVTVGPVKLEISADPGDVVRGELFLMNDEKETKIFSPVFEKFIEENGDKKFIAEKSDLASWFEINYPITLKPQESKNIPFILRIPKDASPGGHFAVIWWSAAVPGAGQVSIVTRAGILVYLRVSGDIKEEAKILQFNTDKKIYWNPPVIFSINLENSGTVYLKPKGEITIKNLFGSTKVIINVNTKDLSILPQSKKTIIEQWDFSGFVLGPYRVRMNLVYGETQKQIQKTLWFFVLPLKLIGIIILIILIVFIAIPQYNRWLLRKYKS